MPKAYYTERYCSTCANHLNTAEEVATHKKKGHIVFVYDPELVDTRKLNW